MTFEMLVAGWADVDRNCELLHFGFRGERELCEERDEIEDMKTP